jgi:hypothetical protein
MQFSGSVVRNSTIVIMIFALGALGATSLAQTQTPPAQAAPQPAPTAVATQPPGICGSQPFCYETQDFAATVTDFRTSKQGYFGIADATIRFVNKTSNPLVLGYANGSGTALDDQGVAYGVGGANALRGMGLVNGASADPKFVLRPGGFGDARFELLTRLPQVYGLTFELNITVNEINILEGNQHTVGSEFPLQFQGLTNGVKGTAPGAVMPGSNGAMATGVSGLFAGAGGAPPACGPAGTVSSIAGATNSAAAQNAANTATTTASNAASALSSITSMFGKKKQAAPAGNAAVTTPCVPAAPVAAAAPAAVPATNAPVAATATPAATAAPAVNAAKAPAAGAVPAASPAAATTNTAAGTTKPAAANAPKSPAPAAKPPVKKPAPTTPSAPKPVQQP